MAKMILIEEFHVTVHAPAGLPEATYLKARRHLEQQAIARSLVLGRESRVPSVRFAQARQIHHLLLNYPADRSRLAELTIN